MPRLVTATEAARACCFRAAVSRWVLYNVIPSSGSCTLRMYILYEKGGLTEGDEARSGTRPRGRKGLRRFGKASGIILGDLGEGITMT
jgi:hypothetical protein